MNRRIKLSERLKALSDMVIPGKSMADIGTDHGFLPLYLLQEDIVPFAALCDVNPGPLNKAKAAADSSGVDPSRMAFFLGDGLKPLAGMEIYSIVIAGMGGELIASILEGGRNAALMAERLVLQPRSRSGELRKWLWKEGFAIKEERLVREKGRICQLFCAEKGIQEPYGVPEIPFGCKDNLMGAFIDKEIADINKVMRGLAGSESLKARISGCEMARKLKALEQMRKDL